MTTDEQWVPIAGWAGYEVSNAGRVRSVDRTIMCRDGQKLAFRGRVLSQTLSQNGYFRVHLRAPGRSHGALPVHRLVAEAFLGNPDKLPAVNHIDNDPTNNRSANLEWCTQLGNLTHARNQGRMPDNYWTGRRSPNAALSDEQVRAIRTQRAAGRSLESLALEFGISKRAIGRLVNGETYQNALPAPPLQAQEKSE